MFALLLTLLLASQGLASDPDAGVVRFTRLYSSSDGETHLQDCTIQDMEKKMLPGGKFPQFVRDLGDLSSGLVFTQMMGENPWHQCPTSQFVVVLEGSWSVNVTSSVEGESKYVEMGPGHVLYQDDYKGVTINGVEPVHYSQSVGEAPCNQIIISTAREYVLDDLSCDWVDAFTN
mmetsp:Transcript_8409/g.16868  ORF Transcript_8409/g.16868 Transcript_8409/m.16868 type:complete len:175 (-) Transcript_8409:66-590(-)